METIAIIGTGISGLGCAYFLQQRYQLTLYEKSDYVGGLCRTVTFKGNRMDVGGHRFFSKSDRVMKWWTEVMPVFFGR